MQTVGSSKMTVAAERATEQDLVIVSKGTARSGEVFIGSILTNSIVGDVSVEIVNNNVVVTVHREDESLFGPVSLVVV